MSLLNDAITVDAPKTGHAPEYAVLWLHGLGADGHDFEPIVPELVAAKWPSIRFIFPHAPKIPVTINAGMSMRAWYDIKSMDRGGFEDVAGMRRSVASVHQALDQLRRDGFRYDRIFLAGFSQGGAITLAAGLRYPHTLAGLLVLSSYLPMQNTLADEQSSESLKTPVFMAHGSFDPVIPLAYAEQSVEVLRQHKMEPEFHRYPMQHSVSGEEILDLRAFMQKRLD